MRYNEGLIEGSGRIETVTEFRGVRMTDDAAGDELYRSKNISLDTPAVLRPRSGRSVIRPVISGGGIYSDDALCWTENGRFYYGGSQIDGLYLTTGKKHICRLGKYILIFPDGIYFNTSLFTDHGSIAATWSVSATVYLDTVDGSFVSVGQFDVSDELPEEPEDGQKCAVAGDDGMYKLKRYDGGRWVDVRTYIKITLNGVGASFKSGDVLEVEGADGLLGSTIRVAYIENNALYCEGVAIKSSVSSLKLKRVMPLLDFAAVSGDRVWGCRYGLERDGGFVCRVYASAPGDPLNWSTLANGGALYADIAGSGAFSGISDFLGSPVLFREDGLIELGISGGRIVQAAVKGEGAERGATQSILTLGGVLYYKSRDAVCAYDGSYPKRISGQLGRLGAASDGAPAGIYNGKYFVKLSPDNGDDGIYSYDPREKAWQCEDDPGVIAFAMRNDLLYAMTGGQSGNIILWDWESADETEREYCTASGYPITEGAVSWRFETGKLGRSDLSGMYPVRLCLRVRNVTTDVSAGLIFDEGAGAKEIKVIPSGTSGTVVLPVPAVRADTVRLYMSGTGKAEILGYSLEYTRESEVRGWS